MSPRPVPVPVKSIEDLPPVVPIEQVMGLYLVTSYAALLRRIKCGRVPAPFAAHPMQWRKADLQEHLGTYARPLSAFGRKRSA